MKKFYCLFLLCCLSFVSFAQVTTTIWATTSGPHTTGSATVAAITYDPIVTGNLDATRAYAVFDLSSIPIGSTIISVDAGIDVAAYNSGATPASDISWNTYGINSDISVITTPASLYAQLGPPGLTVAQLIYNSTYGAAVGDPILPSPGYLGNAVTFIGNNIPLVTSAFPAGKVSLAYYTSTTNTATYTITGETGTTADVFAAGHAPYLMITYCPPPTAVTATAAPLVACSGGTLSLTGSATGATDYSWAGPGGFTSTDQNPSFISTAAASGIYTLTAINTCGAYTASSAPATTASVISDGGAITGATSVWTGFYTQLSDPTPGGTWTSSNPAIDSINSSTGLDSGIAPGTVTITYTTALGCVFTTPLLVISSVFSQLPTVSGAGGGLGFPLVAWYPFCADTSDKSTLGVAGPNPLINSGVGITPAVLTTDRFGIPNDAYAFDGIDNVMYTPTFFPVSAPTLDYTYSCWMEADTAENSIILYNGNPNTDGFGFVLNDGTATGAGSSVSVLFGGFGQFLTTPISLNRWHNLVLKKNGNSYDFYIDHISVGFFITPYNPMTSVFAIGGDYSSTLTTGTLQRAFRGKLDDIAIYNRQLSDAERDSLYNFNPDARVFTLGNDTTICSDSITLFPSPPSLGNDYAWINSLGVTFSTDSAITIDPPTGLLGTTIRLVVGKPFGCFARDTVTIYKAPIPINIGASPIKICLGDTITLTDFTPHSPSTLFAWSTGDTTASIRVATAGYYSVVVDSIYHFTRINSSGVSYADSSICVGRDTVQVEVHPVPIIGLSNYANCQGVSDTIRPHFDSAYNYAFGHPGFAPFNTDSTYVIDNTIGTQVYWIKVNDSGCVRFDTISVLIVWDTLTFFAKDTAFCQGQAWLPSATYLLATDNGIATYQWTPTAGIPVSNVPNPTITPDTSAEYHLTVSYPGCPDISDSFFIDVQPNPIVFPGNNRSVCQFDTIHVVANVTPDWYAHYSYSWSPSNALDASTTSTVVFHPDTVVDVSLVVTVSTPAGCSATDSVQLFVHPGDFLKDSLVYSICPGDSIQFMPYADTVAFPGTTLSSFSWQPSVYLSDSTSATPWVHAVTSTDYNLLARSQYGCKDTLYYKVNVDAAAVMYLGADSITITTGQSYLISPQTNCADFLWYPPLQIDDIHSSTPTVSPVVNTTYIVYGSTANGCKITDSIKIRIAPKSLIDIPNAFTPGANLNNMFMLIPTGTVSLKYFRIFNRWGNKVFETKNIDEGWDGNYNGKPQPFDVYVYEVEAETTSGEVIQRVGNVTLLR